MAAALMVFRDNAMALDQERRQSEERREQATAERRAAMLDLAVRLETRVGDVVRAVTGSSDLLQREAADMAARTQQTRTERWPSPEPANRRRGMSGRWRDATEELAASTSEIARQVQASSGIAGQGVAAAERTDQTIRSMVEAAHRIGEVIEVIRASPPDQPARPQRHDRGRPRRRGRGGASRSSHRGQVARQPDRPRHGRNRSADRQMQSVAGSTVTEISEITGFIRRMSEVSAGIASAVEQQDATTRDISANLQQAGMFTSHVNANLAGVSSAIDSGGELPSKSLKPPATSAFRPANWRERSRNSWRRLERPEWISAGGTFFPAPFFPTRCRMRHTRSSLVSRCRRKRHALRDSLLPRRRRGQRLDQAGGRCGPGQARCR